MPTYSRSTNGLHMQTVELSRISPLEYEGGYIRCETINKREIQWGEIVSINFRGRTKWTRRMVVTVLVDSVATDKVDREFYPHAGLRRKFTIWFYKYWARRPEKSDESVDEAVVIFGGNKCIRMLPKMYHQHLVRQLRRVNYKISNN